MANRIGGILYFTIDGVQYAPRGNFTVTPNRVKREGIAGQAQVDGYTEMPVVPSIKGDLQMVPGLSLLTLEAMTDSVITAALANGTTYVLSGAWSVPPFEADTVEGKVTVEFQGLLCDELVATS
ncbi:MAG TPA: phage tail tube protein [Xanthobacteraceae bacterium]|jgi:hypothetical protein|nr:phage tail tube protein [Xanthobacteraceae bacterium]